MQLKLLLLGFALALLPGPALAVWHEAKSKHFVILGDARESELRRFAERLERIDQAIRFVRKMEDPPLTDSNKLTIFMLPNQDAIARLAGSNFVAGFYIPRVTGAVAFVPRKAGTAEWEMNSEGIFIHEYAHHLQLQDTSAALPEWMIEGFAEFFSTATVRPDGSVDIGLPPQHRGFTLLDPTLSLRVEQLIAGGSHRTDDVVADLFYGRSWALVHYLTFEASRRGQLSRYLAGIHAGQPPVTAARNAFGDLTKLDRQLAQYIRSNVPGQRVHARVLSVGDIATRRLADGQAAIMDVRIRSTSGVNEKRAKEVVADARRIAASYPADPAVQVALAEAEFDVRDFKAAEMAAVRALAADPRNVQAMLYKGRSMAAQAKDSSQGADWAAIRSWFTQANKIDVEAPEPLFRFYESYVLSGVKPPRTAVDALLYAAVLVPQDRSLRWSAVQHLLEDNKLTEAREWFAPLAYATHASEKRRQASAKIMDAIVQGDRLTALRLLRAGAEGDQPQSQDD